MYLNLSQYNMLKGAKSHKLLICQAISFSIQLEFVVVVSGSEPFFS
uniref:Uncharacterized protein n=1 Tax=Anguilla anguilla TaxID=7936 RepID=A0A0E9Q1Y7_ANGAN